MTLSPLAYALIGLALTKPQTGYALRKLFETPPLGGYSSSPGSIYPALTKLTKNGYMEKRAATPTGRPHFHVTSTGQYALRGWLIQPVTTAEIAKDVDLTLLRFVFLQSFPDPSLTLDFLRSFERATQDHLNDLRQFMESTQGQALSLHGRLAMENSIAGYRCHLTWATDALASPSD